MTGTETPRPRRMREGIEDARVRALEMVPPRPWGRRIAVTLIGSLAVVGLGLWKVPWQQSVVGKGRVGVYSVMARPQTVEAQISGRLIEWRVQEGDVVRKGQRIAVLEDIEARYLDPARVRRTEMQLAAQRRRREEELRRVAELEAQVADLGTSRDNQLPAAAQRIAQAQQRRRSAEAAVTVARKNLSIVEEIARGQAEDRIRQAELKVQQAKQSEASAKAALDAEAARRARIGRLAAEGLRSAQDDELAERDLVQRRAQWESARQAVDVAQGDVSLARRTRSQNDLEVQRARELVLQAEAQRDVALRDISVAGFDRARISADTGAGINVAQSNLQAARAAVASVDDTLAKLESDLDALRRRVSQQEVFAPCDGRVVRIGATVGPGQTVKAGDTLALLAPETADQAVELTLRGADAPLVAPGRAVRLQFNGFPAVQISGFPQAATGTFPGVVDRMDRLDDGTGNVRVWVRPAGKWPTGDLLRPGTDAVGWVLLETVPLGYELWRQFNAFPPNFRDPGAAADGKGEDKDGGKDKNGGKKPGGALKPDIKLPKR